MRRRRPGLVAVRAFRGPMLREDPAVPALPPTGPPTDPPVPPEDDDDKPMTRREFKAWQAAQAKPDPVPPKETAPAPPKQDPPAPPTPAPPEDDDDAPSAWFRKKKPRG